MRPDDGQTNDSRVLIVPPTRRDGETTAELLRMAQVECEVCADLPTLAGRLAAGGVEAGVGAVVLTDIALVDPGMEAVLDALTQQPAWSDLPLVLLIPDRGQSLAATRVLDRLTNVTLLDRPVSARSMVSAVQAALRARKRQYQIRDQLAEQRRAEEALREADRRKDEFLATLAHELRNPLAPIRTGLQILARSPGDEAQATRIRDMMERQLGLLVKLVDDLLDVSRITTGKVVLQRERVDMRTIVETAREGSQQAVEAAQHALRLDLPSEPVWAVGDASRLAQVVGNLINNAAKYTPSGGSITVTLNREGGDAVVRVADDGVGIPPDMLERVFDMFTQVNRTLDRAQGGLGIGLSLVRGLMELHGGTVTAESRGLDHGSTFVVRLPVRDAELAVPATANIGPNQRANRPVRVLVVDDNMDAADSLAILLEAEGHRTRTEYSGPAALQAASEFRPDAVFCDIGLPGMDGHEVASRLRADRRHASTLLVALTGWGSEEDKRRTRSAGFDFHLVKPISLEAMDEVLSRL